MRERERLEEIELYLGLLSIRPPIVGNTKAHQTNRLWAQVEVRPNSLIIWVCTIIITPFETIIKFCIYPKISRGKVDKNDYDFVSI